MKPGIYLVTFTSSQRMQGQGIVVFKDGSVNGGDQGYLYLGTYSEHSGTVEAKLKIKKWNQGVVSVFGPLAEFDLNLKGTIAPDGSTFSVNGGMTQMPGATITISGRRLIDAV